MKYSEAIQIAMKDNDFVVSFINYRDNVCNGCVNGSLQFAIGDEAFYVIGGPVYDEVGNYIQGYYFRGGKHTARRSAYLIDRGLIYTIKAT